MEENVEKKKKRKFKLRRIFNMYNIGVVVLIALICGCIYIGIKRDEVVTSSGIRVVSTYVKEGEKISEEKARKAAVKQFKRIGEDVKAEDLTIMVILRDGNEYYYITSSQNSLEIKIDGGKIERINTVPVEE